MLFDQDKDKDGSEIWSHITPQEFQSLRILHHNKNKVTKLAIDLINHNFQTIIQQKISESNSSRYMLL